MEANKVNLYSAVTDHLQQGDIFKQEVVTPLVDSQKRIFRASDGRHGSVVFSEGVTGNVFEHQELVEFLKSNNGSALHTPPFSKTSDGHPELVVVPASLTSHFIIATQTCDICGIDKKAHLAAVILPVLTLKHICRTQNLPFKSQEAPITIEEYLRRTAAITTLEIYADELGYGDLLRKVLAEWKPTEKQLITEQSQIKNYLTRMANYGWMYFLGEDSEFSVPEAYVDFSAAYTVPTDRLQALKAVRIARIADPYRDQFAQSLAMQLSRIAVPVPVKPSPY